MRQVAHLTLSEPGKYSNIDLGRTGILPVSISPLRMRPTECSMATALEAGTTHHSDDAKSNAIEQELNGPGGSRESTLCRSEPDAMGSWQKPGFLYDRLREVLEIAGPTCGELLDVRL